MSDTSLDQGIVYPVELVGDVLGVDTPEDIAIPDPISGYYIVWLPPNIARDLAELRRSTQNLLLEHRAPLDYCYHWFHGQYRTEPGYWQVSVPLPGSNNKTNRQQMAFLQRTCPDFRRTPINVDATLWAVHKLVTGYDVFAGSNIRCLEEPPGMHSSPRAGLSEKSGRLCVCCSWDWLGQSDENIYASAAKKLEGQFVKRRNSNPEDESSSPSSPVLVS